MRRQLATLAQMAAVGLLGGFVFGALGTLLGLGLGLLPVVGIGLAFLALLALALRGIAVVEHTRVEGMLGEPAAVGPMRRSVRTDWTRVPATLSLQFADRRNWIALLHLLLSTLLGAGVLFLARVLGSGLVLPFSPLWASGSTLRLPYLGLTVGPGGAVAAGLISVVVALAGLWGLALAQRVLSRQLLVPSQEEALRSEAQAATQRRAEAIHAADVERSRIERDLHDGVQPRLVSVGMTLGMAKAKLATDPEAAARLIDEAHTSTKAAITELRQLARGFHPAVLEDRGLDAALSALAARSPVPVRLDVQLPGRCGRTTEAAMYFAVAESLTNAAKHSGATLVRVAIRRTSDGTLIGRIVDDGLGGARALPGGGIDGVANRIGAAGGTFSLTSPEGGPTTIEVTLPCAS